MMGINFKGDQRFQDIYDGQLMRDLMKELRLALRGIGKLYDGAAHAPLVLATSTTTIGNVGGGEDDLSTATIQSNTLSNDGDYVEVSAFGTYAANGNNKTIKIILGSTTLYDTTALAANGGSWAVNGVIIRTGAATQKASFTLVTSNTTVPDGATYTAATEDLATTLTFKLTGTGTSNNDIVQQGLVIRKWPAVNL